jgi:hypothetical protein
MTQYSVGPSACSLHEKARKHSCAAVFVLQLQAKTDEGFVRGAFRLCRDHLGVRTVLTPGQFLEQVRVE